MHLAFSTADDNCVPGAFSKADRRKNAGTSFGEQEPAILIGSPMCTRYPRCRTSRVPMEKTPPPKDPFHVQTCNKFHANISTDLIPSDDSKSNTSVVGIRLAQRVGLVRSRSNDQTNNQAVQTKGLSMRLRQLLTSSWPS